MTATNHALAGAVIALAVKQPALAIPLAFASHFVMDAIPHFDVGLSSPRLAKVAIPSDILIASCLTIGLSLFLKGEVAAWLIFTSACAAMSPDLVWGWRYYKLRNLRKIVSAPMSSFTRFHLRIQWRESQQGIIVEIIWFILMLWLAIQVRK